MRGSGGRVNRGVWRALSGWSSLPFGNLPTASPVPPRLCLWPGFYGHKNRPKTGPNCPCPRPTEGQSGTQVHTQEPLSRQTAPLPSHPGPRAAPASSRDGQAWREAWGPPHAPGALVHTEAGGCKPTDKPRTRGSPPGTAVQLPSSRAAAAAELHPAHPGGPRPTQPPRHPPLPTRKQRQGQGFQLRHLQAGAATPASTSPPVRRGSSGRGSPPVSVSTSPARRVQGCVGHGRTCLNPDLACVGLSFHSCELPVLLGAPEGTEPRQQEMQEGAVIVPKGTNPGPSWSLSPRVRGAICTRAGVTQLTGHGAP